MEHGLDNMLRTGSALRERSDHNPAFRGSRPPAQGRQVARRGGGAGPGSVNCADETSRAAEEAEMSSRVRSGEGFESVSSESSAGLHPHYIVLRMYQKGYRHLYPHRRHNGGQDMSD